MRHLKTLNKKAMPQSLVKNNIHLVFSTKNRENMICVEDYEELRAYLIGVLSEFGCYLEELGGTENHIHLLFVLNKKLSISEVVGKIKANTSRWFHKRYGKEFSWQSGYGAFSVSQSKVEVAVITNCPRRKTMRTNCFSPSDVIRWPRLCMHNRTNVAIEFRIRCLWMLGE